MLLEVAQALYKEQHKAFPEPFRIRIYRALSWLNKALSIYQDSDKAELDFTFISLWVSFNAIYGKDLSSALRAGDKQAFREFLNLMHELDTKGDINRIVWGKFSHCLRLLLQNRYTFQKYWDFVNGDLSAQDWEQAFEGSNRRALKALSEQNTSEILSIIFDRLYTIRNQLVHGGATFGSSLNRKQIDDSIEFLLMLIPQMLILMMQHADKCELFGRPFYLPIRE